MVGTDVTASSGTNIVLSTGAALGDIIDIVAFGVFNVANTYTQSAADAKFGFRSCDGGNATSNYTAIPEINGGNASG